MTRAATWGHVLGRGEGYQQLGVALLPAAPRSPWIHSLNRLLQYKLSLQQPRLLSQRHRSLRQRSSRLQAHPELTQTLRRVRSGMHLLSRHHTSDRCAMASCQRKKCLPHRARQQLMQSSKNVPKRTCLCLLRALGCCSRERHNQLLHKQSLHQPKCSALPADLSASRSMTRPDDMDRRLTLQH
jgi:hypothetical protein